MKKILIVILISALMLSVFYMYRTTTGDVTAVATVNVTSLVMISLPVNSVDFGVVSQCSARDTVNNTPPPFLIRNDGTVAVDLTINRDPSSAPLFTGMGSGDNTSTFQFKVDFPADQMNPFDYGASLTNWTNVPGTIPLTFVRNLKYPDGSDTAEVDLRISVPCDESPGEKSELINFLASQSSYSSSCLLMNVQNAGLKDPKKIWNILINNTCNNGIVVNKIRVSRTNDLSDLKRISAGISSFEDKWYRGCGWGCFPKDMQPSGVLLDFGQRNITLTAGGYSNLIIEYDKDIRSGTSFTVEVITTGGLSAVSNSFTV